MEITKPVLGIDIAKEKFDVALLMPNGQQPLQQEFDNNAQGRKKLLKWLDRNSTGPCLAGMEATGCYGMPLLLALHEAGHRCHLLKAKKVKNHITARGQRNKTDRQDALAISDFVLKHEPAQWQPLSAERQEVKELNQVLIELQEVLKRSKNRLAAAKNLCSYAGVYPCNFESGKSVKKAARVAFDCQRKLRRMLALAGVAAMTPHASNPALVEFRERLKNGKRQLNGRALAMALGHKLLRIIYGVHKSGKRLAELAMSRALQSNC